jgi:hypothetical protein
VNHSIRRELTHTYVDLAGIPDIDLEVDPGNLVTAVPEIWDQIASEHPRAPCDQDPHTD